MTETSVKLDRVVVAGRLSAVQWPFRRLRFQARANDSERRSGTITALAFAGVRSDAATDVTSGRFLSHGSLITGEIGRRCESAVVNSAKALG